MSGCWGHPRHRPRSQAAAAAPWVHALLCTQLLPVSRPGADPACALPAVRPDGGHVSLKAETHSV